MTDFIILFDRHGYNEAFKALVLIERLTLIIRPPRLSEFPTSILGAEDETPPLPLVLLELDIDEKFDYNDLAELILDKPGRAKLKEKTLDSDTNGQGKNSQDHGDLDDP
ncbi:hypothetical protein Tco_1311489 [Tanacetum coccineum]